MARFAPFEHYKCYRFDLKAKDGASIRCERVWSDPFEPESLWIVRAHGVDQPTLDQWLWRCKPEAPVLTRYECVITMQTDAEGNTGRRLRVRFVGWKWLPLDLDAQSDGVAQDHAKLVGVEYELEDGAPAERTPEPQPKPPPAPTRETMGEFMERHGLDRFDFDFLNEK